LEILVEISGFYSAVFAHMISGKVIKAFVTILNGFRAKVHMGGKIPPPIAT